MAAFNAFGKFFGNGDSNSKNGARSSRRQRQQNEVAKRSKRDQVKDSLEILEQRWLPTVSITENPIGTINIIYGDPLDSASISGFASNLTAAGTGSPGLVTGNSITKILVSGVDGYTSTLTINGTNAIRNPSNGGSLTFAIGSVTVTNLYQDISGVITNNLGNTNVRLFADGSAQDGLDIGATTVSTQAGYSSSAASVLNTAGTTFQITNGVNYAGNISVLSGILNVGSTGTVSGNIALSSSGCLTSSGAITGNNITNTGAGLVTFSSSTDVNINVTSGILFTQSAASLGGILNINNVASFNLLGNATGTVNIGGSATGCITSCVTNLSVSGTPSVCITGTSNISASTNISGGTVNILAGGIVSGLVVSGSVGVVNIQGSVIGDSSISGSTVNYLTGYSQPGNMTVSGGTVNALTGVLTPILTQSGGTVYANTISTQVNQTGGCLTVNGTVPTVNQSGISCLTVGATGNVTTTTNISGGTFLNLGNVTNLTIDGSSTSATNNATINGTPITVNNGTLRLNSCGTMTDPDISVVLNNNAVLYTSANMAGTLVLNNYSCATLNPSCMSNSNASANTVSVQGNATFISNGTVIGGLYALAAFDYSSVTLQSGSTIVGDVVMVSGGSPTLSIAGNVTGNLISYSGVTTVTAGGMINGLSVINDSILNVCGTVSSNGTISTLIVGNETENGTANIYAYGVVSGTTTSNSIVNVCGTLSGTLAVNNGTTTILTTGRVSGVSTLENGVLNINGTQTGALQVNNGTANVLSSGNVVAAANLAAGSLIIGGRLSSTLSVNGGTARVTSGGQVIGVSTVNVTGTLNVYGISGSNGSISSLIVNTDGVANVGQYGYVSLDTQSNGSLLVNGTLAGNLVVTANTTVVGSCGTVVGVLTANGGTTNITNGGNIVGAATLNNAGTVLNSNGRLSSTFQVNNGTATIQTGGYVVGSANVAGGLLVTSNQLQGTLSIHGGTANVISGGLVLGTTTVQSGYLNVYGATGTAQVACLTVATTGSAYISANGLVSNQTIANGPLTVDGGCITSNLTINSNITNIIGGGNVTGLTTLNGGVLNVNSTTVSPQSSLGCVTLTGGTTNIGANGLVSNTIIANSALNVTGCITGNLQINANTVSVSDGANISGSTTVYAGVILVSGVSTEARIGVLTIQAGGLANITANGNVSGAAISNGTLNVSGGKISNSLTINNGTTNVTAGGNVTGLTTLTGSYLNVYSTSSNLGVINTLTLTGGVANISANGLVRGAVTTNSTLLISSKVDSTISVTGGGTNVTAGGNVTGLTTVSGGSVNVWGTSVSAGEAVMNGIVVGDLGSANISSFANISGTVTTQLSHF